SGSRPPVARPAAWTWSADSARHRWQGYCSQAGAGLGIHPLRHAHATELINSEVSIEAVRRRLGHASTETTQLYALLEDEVADAELPSPAGAAAGRHADHPQDGRPGR